MFKAEYEIFFVFPGEASTAAWTNNRLQDTRGMGHPYPSQPLPSANTPWQTRGAMLPDDRAMPLGWRPTAMTNGVTTQATSHLEQIPESVQPGNVISNNDPVHGLQNDINDTVKDSAAANSGLGERKGTGMQ